MVQIQQDSVKNSSVVIPRRGGGRRSFIFATIVIFLPALYINGFFDTKTWKQLSEQGSFENKGAIIHSSTSARVVSKHQLIGNERCQSQQPQPNDGNNKRVNQRWSSQPHIQSDVQSLFNCDLPQANCKYYYPANFLDRHCGLGKEFAYHVDDATAKHANGTLWNFQQAIGFPTLTVEHMCIDDTAVASAAGRGTINLKQPSRIRTRMDPRATMLGNSRGTGTSGKLQSEKHLTNIGERQGETENIRCITERLSFLHVHKAGGSSLHEAFNSIARNNREHAAIVRHKHFSPSQIPGVPDQTHQANSEGMKIFTLLSLEEATRYPSENHFDSKQHVIFAAVRDPTERFISSIGQAVGGFGSNPNNKIAKVLKHRCVKTTSKAALNCIAKYVRDYGFWIELHFTPQVLVRILVTLRASEPHN